MTRIEERLTPIEPGGQVSPNIEELLFEEPETPFLVDDLDVVAERYRALAAALPKADICYAVKANPEPAIIRLLLGLGCRFDFASTGEIDLCLAAGADGAQLSFGNTVKKASAITRAFGHGVGLFAFDSDSELDKLIRLAPGSTLFCRVLSDGSCADWPVSRKFGCTPELAFALLLRAVAAGHDVGVSFHIGSQQRDTGAWDRALSGVADLLSKLRGHGVEPGLVNLGGAFPGQYLEAVDDGAELVLNSCGQGELLSEVSAIDGLPRSASAVAVGPVEVLALPSGQFNRLIEAHPALALQVLRLLANRPRIANDERVLHRRGTPRPKWQPAS